MKTIPVRVSESTYNQCKLVAEKQGKCIGEVLDDLMNWYISKKRQINYLKGIDNKKL